MFRRTFTSYLTNDFESFKFKTLAIVNCSESREKENCPKRVHSDSFIWISLKL